MGSLPSILTPRSQDRSSIAFYEIPEPDHPLMHLGSRLVEVDACPTVTKLVPQPRVDAQTEFRENLEVGNLLKIMVGRDGIEPPTPGFSVRPEAHRHRSPSDPIAATSAVWLVSKPRVGRYLPRVWSRLRT